MSELATSGFLLLIPELWSGHGFTVEAALWLPLQWQPLFVQLDGNVFRWLPCGNGVGLGRLVQAIAALPTLCVQAGYSNEELMEVRISHQLHVFYVIEGFHFRKHGFYKALSGLSCDRKPRMRGGTA